MEAVLENCAGSPCDYSFDVQDFEQIMLAGGCCAYFWGKVPEVTSEDALGAAVRKAGRGTGISFPTTTSTSTG
ncbi:hypothetical protein SY88_22385 [Clostridiales bacterium PH28_bin88]|nr:hypothetical protein SY88_22385 [Clostridiales bacterium PH28_bin88]